MDALDIIEKVQSERDQSVKALQKALRVITDQEQEILRLKRKCGEAPVFSFAKEISDAD